jgi:hypothetical protein
MNPYVVAGALVLFAAIAWYVITSRRMLAKLPPLAKKTPKEEARKKK